MPYRKINTIIIIFNTSLSLFYYNVELTPTTIKSRQHIKLPQTSKVFLPNLPEIAPQTNENIVKDTFDNKANILAVS